MNCFQSSFLCRCNQEDSFLTFKYRDWHTYNADTTQSGGWRIVCLQVAQGERMLLLTFLQGLQIFLFICRNQEIAGTDYVQGLQFRCTNCIVIFLKGIHGRFGTTMLQQLSQMFHTSHVLVQFHEYSSWTGYISHRLLPKDVAPFIAWIRISSWRTKGMLVLLKASPRFTVHIANLVQLPMHQVWGGV